MAKGFDFRVPPPEGAGSTSEARRSRLKGARSQGASWGHPHSPAPPAGSLGESSCQFLGELRGEFPPSDSELGTVGDIEEPGLRAARWPNLGCESSLSQGSPGTVSAASAAGPGLPVGSRGGGLPTAPPCVACSSRRRAPGTASDSIAHSFSQRCMPS